MNETYHAVQDIQAATKRRKDGLFFADEFNVKCFTTKPLSLLQNVPARLVNAFTKAANENNKLPRMVVFIPDWDIVKYVNYFQLGVKDMFSQILGWIMTNVMRVIQSKKDKLEHRNAGSIISSEPKIIWVKMIECIGGEYNRALTTRYRFNAALENQLAARKNHFVFDIGKAIADPGYFTMWNDLTGDGKSRYWCELDNSIQMFEYDKDPFKPKWEISMDPHKKPRKNSGDRRSLSYDKTERAHHSRDTH